MSDRLHPLGMTPLDDEDGQTGKANRVPLVDYDACMPVKVATSWLCIVDEGARA